MSANKGNRIIQTLRGVEFKSVNEVMLMAFLVGHHIGFDDGHTEAVKGMAGVFTQNKPT